jgi:hypothetical protein
MKKLIVVALLVVGVALAVRLVASVAHVDANPVHLVQGDHSENEPDENDPGDSSTGDGSTGGGSNSDGGGN